MKVYVNEEEFNYEESIKLHKVLKAYGAQPPYAVMLNGDFLPRSEYESASLQDGDKIDVVGAIQGG